MGDLKEFVTFRKIPRLSREIIITEKIDGTNSVIYIGEDGEFLTGSRNRWITPEDDNYGFSKWAHENKEELMKLGPGYHFGEWAGKGIQSRYKNSASEKSFFLFNVSKWENDRPSCCRVVPVLYRGEFDTSAIKEVMGSLSYGSNAYPECKNPEGVVIYHVAAGVYFKKTFENDDMPKVMVGK